MVESLVELIPAFSPGDPPASSVAGAFVQRPGHPSYRGAGTLLPTASNASGGKALEELPACQRGDGVLFGRDHHSFWR